MEMSRKLLHYNERVQKLLQAESAKSGEQNVNAIVPQDETTKQSLASHYTISRDETSSGSSMKDKLQVLRTAQNDESLDFESVDIGSTRRHSRTESSDSEKSEKSVELVRRARRPERYKSAEEDAKSEVKKVDLAHSIANEIPANTPSELYGLVLLLQEKVKALQGKSEERQQQNQRENESSVEFAVFHCMLDDEDEETNETYLEKPYWVATSDGYKIKANSPVLYPDAYVQYKSLAFIVYQYYSRDREESSRAFQGQPQNEILDPTPSKELIRLVSKDMKEAVKTFASINKDFENKSLPILIDGEMQAPYHWWWYYRQQSNLFANLSQPQVELIRSLTNWIDDKYIEIYSRTHNQFERGMVSEASMGFLIQPGDILVQRRGDIVDACLATSWPKRKISAATFQQQWNIDTWSYRYNGKFYRVSETLNVKFEAESETTEIPIAELSAFPLRFAPITLRQSLKHRGKTFWGCRYRKYVSYARESKEDYTVSIFHPSIHRDVLLNLYTARTALYD